MELRALRLFRIMNLYPTLVLKAFSFFVVPASLNVNRSAARVYGETYSTFGAPIIQKKRKLRNRRVDETQLL